MRPPLALFTFLAVFFGFGAAHKSPNEDVHKDLWIKNGLELMEKMFDVSPPIILEEEAFIKDANGQPVVCNIDILEEYIVYVWDYDAEKLPRNRVLLRDNGNRVVYQNFEYKSGTVDDQTNVCYFYNNIPDDLQGYLHAREVELPTNKNRKLPVFHWRRYVTCHYKSNLPIGYLTREERFDNLGVSKRDYLKNKKWFYSIIKNRNHLWREGNEKKDEEYRACLAHQPETCEPKKPDFNLQQFRYMVFYGPMLLFCIIHIVCVMFCC